MEKKRRVKKESEEVKYDKRKGGKEGAETGGMMGRKDEENIKLQIKHKKGKEQT